MTAPARADSSELRIGTKKRALQIEQRNSRRKKCGALPNLLDKKAPYKGLGADSEEKQEPASDIDTALMDSLKVLDPDGPIREADSSRTSPEVRFVRDPDMPATNYTQKKLPGGDSQIHT